MAKVQGTCDDRFAEIRQLLQANIDNEKELGASITINIDGKEVVDIWGGYSDTDRSKPWEKDTITNVWSTTKTVTALAALVLIDRGLLDPNEKVAKYWPEFAANGKENIEVRHLLSHASGLSSWQEPVTFEDIFDREKSAALLAAQAPWWTAGTATGYHSITFGNLVRTDPPLSNVTNQHTLGWGACLPHHRQDPWSIHQRGSCEAVGSGFPAWL